MKKIIFLLIVIMNYTILNAEERIYFYSNSYEGSSKGSVTVESVTALGVRSTRPFGEDGFEQRLGVSVGVIDRIQITGSGGIAWDSDGKNRGTSGSLEVLINVLNNKDHNIKVSLGTGYNYDYTDTHILSFRGLIGKDFGKLNLTANGIVEKPFAEDRDPVDFITSLGTSYRVTKRFNAGLEFAGEDLEGLWEEEEAEGGARFLMGPTLKVALSQDEKLQLMPSAAWVYSVTKSINAPQTSESGFVGRVGLIYSF